MSAAPSEGKGGNTDELAVQQMARSANSKVVFVPMQLQSDVVSQMQASGSGSGVNAGLIQSQSGESAPGDSHGSVGAVSRAGLLNSMSEV